MLQRVLVEGARNETTRLAIFLADGANRVATIVMKSIAERGHHFNARTLSPAQKAVAPLAPIFAACKKAGMTCTEANKVRRVYAVNRYCALMPFDFIESFKDMLNEPAQIIVVADAIESGVLAW